MQARCCQILKFVLSYFASCKHMLLSAFFWDMIYPHSKKLANSAINWPTRYEKFNLIICFHRKFNHKKLYLCRTSGKLEFFLEAPRSKIMSKKTIISGYLTFSKINILNENGGISEIVIELGDSCRKLGIQMEMA